MKKTKPMHCKRCGEESNGRVMSPAVGLNLWTTLCFPCSMELHVLTCLMFAANCVTGKYRVAA